MGVRIGPHRLVKGFEYERIIIAFSNHIGHNAPIIEVQNGSEIDFVYVNTLIPFGLGHIGQPLFIRLFRIELAVQQVFRQVLRILGPSDTAMAAVLYGRANISGSANMQHSLIVDVEAVINGAGYR